LGWGLPGFLMFRWTRIFLSWFGSLLRSGLWGRTRLRSRTRLRGRPLLRRWVCLWRRSFLRCWVYLRSRGLVYRLFRSCLRGRVHLRCRSFLLHGPFLLRGPFWLHGPFWLRRPRLLHWMFLLSLLHGRLIGGLGELTLLDGRGNGLLPLHS